MLGILMDERCPLQSTNERCGACSSLPGSSPPLSPIQKEAMANKHVLMILKQKNEPKRIITQSATRQRSHSKMIPQEISTWNVFCSVRKHLLDGSLAQACPCRWVKLATHRHWGPLCVYPVLSCPLWPCNRRVRVIAKETGQSPQAHKCIGTWTCLRRLHIRSRQKTTIQKIGDSLPRDTLPLSLSVHLRKPRYKNVAIVSPETRFLCL